MRTIAWICVIALYAISIASYFYVRDISRYYNNRFIIVLWAILVVIMIFFTINVLGPWLIKVFKKEKED